MVTDSVVTIELWINSCYFYVCAANKMPLLRYAVIFIKGDINMLWNCNDYGPVRPVRPKTGIGFWRERQLASSHRLGSLEERCTFSTMSELMTLWLTEPSFCFSLSASSSQWLTKLLILTELSVMRRFNETFEGWQNFRIYSKVQTWKLRASLMTMTTAQTTLRECKRASRVN